MRQLRLLIFFVVSITLCSCASIGFFNQPNLKKETQDRFKSATDHEMMKIHSKEHRLGYVYENGAFVKKVWGGRLVESATGQVISLTYTKQDFDKLKLFLGSEFDIGAGLENTHHVRVELENIRKFELVDFQPLIEYMGKDDQEIIRKDFVISMIKVSKFSVVAYQKFMGEFGPEYRPNPMVKIAAKTGSSTSREEEQKGYDIFIGYKLYKGGIWWRRNFESAPKVDIEITTPKPDAVIDRVKAKVKGSIIDYHTLKAEYQDKMQLYVMTRDEYEDEWTLQPKATIDTNGDFTGIVELGSTRKGDGHTYSIAVFVTYFRINREVNSQIPILPFNKGKYIIQVKRKDEYYE